ncbi:MAG: DEAD/DEAH box helicase [Thermodesulfobacteriota bacterium]
MKFSILNIHKDLLEGIAAIGFERCTPVQEQSLPETLAGKDVIVQSQTGTGKTAVFVITAYNSFLSGEPKKTKGPRALVMAPTRELAVQIEKEAEKLARHTPFHSVAIYGGVEYEKQISALRRGVELVVATPGRMIDLYKSKSLSLDDIEVFIVDEADRMFDMGFAPDIRYIAGRLPKGKPRQTMLFSATIDTNVHRLASSYMKPDPVVVEIEPEQVTVDKIDQKALYISNEEKLPALMALLNRPDMERAIIFTNMKRTAEMLEWKLAGNGFSAEVLTGDVTQSRRQRIIDGMKSGKLRILVATDVAARGLHIEDVSHVINFDLPQEAASYVHRIGRTARAGKSGKAYSLVCEEHAWNLPAIEEFIERKIEVEWLKEEEMVEDKAGSYRKKRPPRKEAERGRGKSSRSGPAATKGGRGGSGGRDVRKPSAPGRYKDKRTSAGAAPAPEPEKITEKSFASKDKKAGPGIGTGPRPPRAARKGPGERRGREGGEGGDGGAPKKAQEPSMKQGAGRAAKGPDGGRGRGKGEKPAGVRSSGRGGRGRGDKEGLAPKSREDRIALYKEKYGEEFRPVEESGKGRRRGKGKAGKKSEVGMLKRILKAFSKSS